MIMTKRGLVKKLLLGMQPLGFCFSNFQVHTTHWGSHKVWSLISHVQGAVYGSAVVPSHQLMLMLLSIRPDFEYQDTEDCPVQYGSPYPLGAVEPLNCGLSKLSCACK